MTETADQKSIQTVTEEYTAMSMTVLDVLQAIEHSLVTSNYSVYQGRMMSQDRLHHKAGLLIILRIHKAMFMGAIL